MQQHAEKAEQINAQFEAARKSREDKFKQVEEAELRLRELEAARQGSQVSAQRRTEKEQQLNAEIEALRQAEAEQLKRIAEAEVRLRTQEEARAAARAKVKELAETEQQHIGDRAHGSWLKTRTALEELKETEEAARLHAEEDTQVRRRGEATTH